MAKKDEPRYHTCYSGGKSVGIVFIILGILMLLQNLGVISFFKVSGWTIILLVIGAWLVSKKEC
ncbi:hypothetical protein C4573_02375 [Candidatus Woesearchaeota archaeon]|nr:MAG: hypothetical protein C4573_02375 [Candidatus Woesearchaeota archaeon]